MSQYTFFEGFEDEDENDLNYGSKSFEDSVIWGTDWTTETIVNQLKRRNIDLNPKFQRRNAWDNITKSRFIESIILGLPIPQIILAERNDEKGKYIVIDGKQRLLTILSFFSKDNDVFTPFKLKGLNILKNLNGKSYEDLEYSSIINQLNNQSIRTSIIKNWKNEDFLYTVFLRLNTGSLKLSPQELRQALHPGKFIDFADDFSGKSNQILSLLKLSEPDSRMRDVELYIRFFNYKYFIEQYDGNLKKSFDLTVSKLNQDWNSKEDEIIKDSNRLNISIDITNEIFGEKYAFSKFTNNGYQNNFNRAIFDIMTYYFSNIFIHDKALTKKEEIKNKFEELCLSDIEFIKSFEHTTKSVQNVAYRFNVWGKTLNEVLEINNKIPTLVNNRIKIK